MSKKAVAILLALGILMAGAGIVNAATLSITANVASSITLALNPGSFTFDNVQPGVASASQQLTTTTTGNDVLYNLQLSSTTFTTAGPAQPASTLQYKPTASGTYASASATPTNMMPGSSTATVGGDEQTFDLRVNFQSSANNGTYAATVTITATPS